MGISEVIQLCCNDVQDISEFFLQVKLLTKCRSPAMLVSKLNYVNLNFRPDWHYRTDLTRLQPTESTQKPNTAAMRQSLVISQSSESDKLQTLLVLLCQIFDAFLCL